MKAQKLKKSKWMMLYFIATLVLGISPIALAGFPIAPQSSFMTESEKHTNPAVAIQHNGDVTNKDDNTPAEKNTQSTSRFDFRIYTGIEFSNRSEKDEGLWNDPKSFLHLQFVNQKLDSKMSESIGQFSAGFGLFLDQKAKSASNADEETQQSLLSSGVPDLEQQIINAETAGLSYQLAYWPITLNYFNINLRGESYFETEDPDEAKTDWYALFGFAKRFGHTPEDANTNNNFSVYFGYANLENIVESERFYTQFQWDIKVKPDDDTSFGLSVEYHTPLRSSVDGEDDLQIRLFIALAPDTLKRVFNFND